MMTAWKSVVGTDDTVLNGGDIALAGSLGESGRARIREAPGRKILVVGNHDFNRRTGLLGRRRTRGRHRNPGDRHRSRPEQLAPETRHQLERNAVSNTREEHVVDVLTQTGGGSGRRPPSERDPADQILPGLRELR